jgi:hypothetical protein
MSDDWWGVREAAAHCGVKPPTWRYYVSRGFAPPPDDTDEGSPPERRRPRWKPETVKAWDDGRPIRRGK